MFKNLHSSKSETLTEQHQDDQSTCVYKEALTDQPQLCRLRGTWQIPGARRNKHSSQLQPVISS